MHFKSIKFLKNIRFSAYLLACILVVASVTLVKAEVLRVAVASNFLKTAQKLRTTYEKRSKHSIQLSSGSSGKFYWQIANGAPFDIFLSADTHKPKQLISHGYAIAGTRQTYAIGRLSLWLKNCPQVKEISILKNPSIKKIALANPKLAPYGMASKKLLEKYQLSSSLKSKLVFPENISQVSQLVKAGVIDAAFIASSQAKSLIFDQQNCLINLPEKDYPIIEQQLVLLTNSNKQAIAREFIQFINTKEAQNLIKNMGYSISESGNMAK